MDNVIKTRHEDRRYKDCQCCICKKVQECTPDNDFYTTENHGDDLVCEQCFWEYEQTMTNEDRDKAIKVLDMIVDDMENDAKEFDGKLFNGKTVAAYFGNQGAAIAALAKSIKEIYGTLNE